LHTENCRTSLSHVNYLAHGLIGAKGLATWIRQTDLIPEEAEGLFSEENLESGIEASVEVVNQTRQFLDRALSKEEREIYAQPRDRLGAALGRGLKNVAQRKPLVIFFDTYEIVDRPACDYGMRQVMKAAGDRVLWVVSGRANLATSLRRGKENFYGYQREFDQERLYARSLSEFGVSEIREYFQQAVPEKNISEAELNAIADFSLGIPFVVAQAAAMWQEGTTMEEIVAPVAQKLGESMRDEVVKTTCERFLVHCFDEKRDRDLQIVYGLAMLRQPDVGVLQAMLEVEDLETELQNLQQRYSFVLVDRMRLDEKLADFLQGYLLVPIRREGVIVKPLNDRAIDYLTRKLEGKTKALVRTSHRCLSTSPFP
jgi:hypothetical protein